MPITKELVESFQPVSYSRVQRGENSYNETYELTVNELERLVGMYKQLSTSGQTARLLRDSIDHWIRRYHGYAIEGSIGSHYIQVGVDKNKCIFEHVIPAAKVRDMLLQEVLTVKQSLNTPTCLISNRNDDILREEGHVSSSPIIGISLIDTKCLTMLSLLHTMDKKLKIHMNGH